MDSARAFRKYLSARIRAERMELLPTTQRHPPLQRYNHNYSRLPAGGRLGESFHLNLNRFVGRKSSQKTPPKSDVLDPQPQTKSKKVKSKCRLKFKNPVLVVRSRPRLECSSSSEGASIKVRFSKSPLRPGNLREQPPLSCVTDQKQSCSIIEAKSSPCPIIETKSSPVTKERHISFTEVEQPPCDTLITQQLTTLMQKLEDQLANERKQKEELNAINSQLKQLTGTVTNLNDKCKQFETEKSKLKLEQPCLGNQGCEEKLCHKPSSICQFCAHQQLPVLCSMQNELFQLMGKRLFSDVALTILLRADNVYHVNVRDLDTGKVLGCLLVNETGIKQANSLGIFQEILTFCVIDVRSSMSTRDAIFGGINFEFVRDQRLHGGHSGQRKQLFREMHCPINSLKADQAVARAPHRCSSFQHQREKKSKSKLSISQALLQIGTIDKSLVLSDDEANYPVSGIEIVSMMGSSPPCSEMDTAHSSVSVQRIEKLAKF
ncbi:uncharacterized protein LOC133838485 isoform X2 [Drosophila sulfurigaster albostrigata]|uniref:uncharacterized protein LOC133838485 isoform X2 n=1 Tax=Drosophila sulfurigaster albostrigata TaxID=89887 RepID=UPI002D218D71|nr:uncharacterized protein LOC133838485 isoform X2 [Drosophila sulfurigaster albostrigata]